MWVEFFWGEFTVFVFIEFFERFRCVFKFLGGERAVPVGIKDFNDGRFAMRWLFRIVWGIYRRHTEFFHGDFSISVFVKALDGICCAPHFLAGKLAIAVSIEGRCERGCRGLHGGLARWRAGSSVGFLGQGRGGDDEKNEWGKMANFHKIKA